MLIMLFYYHTLVSCLDILEIYKNIMHKNILLLKMCIIHKGLWFFYFLIKLLFLKIYKIESKHI